MEGGVESEREEGEIVDDVDELSDISSEEELLLRERLQVLENYNNVLERKEAKRLSAGCGQRQSKSHNDFELLLPDLSDISGSELSEVLFVGKRKHRRKKEYKKPKLLKSIKKHKYENKNSSKLTSNDKITKENQQQIGQLIESVDLDKSKKEKVKRKKKGEPKIVPETSDESDDEYRNKRRRLQNAVKITTHKDNDKSSLKSRIMNMLFDKTRLSEIPEPPSPPRFSEIFEPSSPPRFSDIPEPPSPPSFDLVDAVVPIVSPNKLLNKDNLAENYEDVEVISVTKNIDMIDLCTKENVIVSDSTKPIQLEEDQLDNDLKAFEKSYQNRNNDKIAQKKIESKEQNESNENIESDSDEDIETLRQNALQTKAAKAENFEKQITQQHEDQDSDTEELRQICLKSAFLKKAIEVKQKQKLRKRLSTLSQDSFMDDLESILEKPLAEDTSNIHDNTDNESVDMELDAPDVNEENLMENVLDKIPEKDRTLESDIILKAIKPSDDPNNIEQKEDDLEEDEDLLRTKLLTSLSRNLPKLYTTPVKEPVSILKVTSENNKEVGKEKPKQEAKKFIINLQDSDSGSDNERTKNLTKMHAKLSEKVDFEARLNLFLKTKRKEAEKETTQTNDGKPTKSPEKFVPKALNHLPKSGQLEYKRLVKRMADLEKMKQARQLSLNPINSNMRITLKENKPRNVVNGVNNGTTAVSDGLDLEAQIASSRKRIAEESAKVLKLKDEESKLSQKHKIVMTELRNIRTAISLNKRNQHTAQAYLAQMMTQHKMLISRSSNALHRSTKIVNTTLINRTYKKSDLPNSYTVIPKPSPVQELLTKPSPVKELLTKPNLEAVKVSILNDLQQKAHDDFLVKVDFSSNKKTVTLLNETNTIEKENDNNNEQKVRERKVSISKEIALGDISKKNTQLFTNASEQGVTEMISKMKDVIQNKLNTSDYRSPLDALKVQTSWSGDPHGVLCPFDVSGTCKDAECCYLHTAH